MEIGRANRGNYRQWVAQAGTLVADLLTIAGADHVITMDLHVPSIRFDGALMGIDDRTLNSRAFSIFLWTIYLDGLC